MEGTAGHIEGEEGTTLTGEFLFSHQIDAVSETDPRAEAVGFHEIGRAEALEAGGTKIGSLKHLPPTLTVQYHFTGSGDFKPYLGAGLNYTRFSSVEFIPAVEAALSPSIDKNSFGLAFQAGFDYKLSTNVYLNFDVKKVQIRTDVSSAGTKVGEFRVDPWLIGIGIGQRF